MSTETKAKRFLLPRVYPGGGPLYWRNETTGALAGAVMAYIRAYAGRAEASDEQLVLVAGYLSYWIDCPIWRDTGDGELAALRESARTISTREEISAWIHRAVAAGFDPL